MRLKTLRCGSASIPMVRDRSGLHLPASDKEMKGCAV
jgi:hypothetical protein